jgi:hypothetical protein
VGWFTRASRERREGRQHDGVSSPACGDGEGGVGILSSGEEERWESGALSSRCPWRRGAPTHDGGVHDHVRDLARWVDPALQPLELRGTEPVLRLLPAGPAARLLLWEFQSKHGRATTVAVMAAPSTGETVAASPTAVAAQASIYALVVPRPPQEPSAQARTTPGGGSGVGPGGSGNGSRGRAPRRCTPSLRRRGLGRR